MGLAGGEASDGDLGQASFPEFHDEEVLEAVDPEDGTAGLVFHHRRPGVPSERRDESLRDHEVFRGGPIVTDEEPAAVVLDVVLEALAAGFDQRQRGVRAAGIHEMPLGHVVSSRDDIDEAAAQGLGDTDEEALVLLLVNQPVVGRVLAEAVAEDLDRPVVLVQHGVEEGQRCR